MNINAKLNQKEQSNRQDNLAIPLHVGEEVGDYRMNYYCMNCNGDLKHEHQEKCEQCGQIQLW